VPIRRLAGRPILLVEDEPVNTLDVKRALRNDNQAKKIEAVGAEFKAIELRIPDFDRDPCAYLVW